jgi:hypothetical protein
MNIFNEYNNILDELKFLNDNCLYLYQIKCKFKNLNNLLIDSLELLRKTYNNDDINNHIARYITILLKL